MSSFSATPTGMVLALLYCMASSAAAVSTEWIYKRAGKEQSIHVQNIGMYIGGLLINYVGYLMQQYQRKPGQVC